MRFSVCALLVVFLVGAAFGQPIFVDPTSPCFRAVSANVNNWTVTAISTPNITIQALSFSITEYQVIPGPAPVTIVVTDATNNLQASFNLTANDYYTVFITQNGSIGFVRDSNTQTTLTTTRFRVLALANTPVNMSVNGRPLGQFGSGQSSPYYTDSIDATIPGNLTQYIQATTTAGITMLNPIGLIAEKYTAFFLGRTYTIIFQRRAGVFEFVINEDTDLGIILPKAPLTNTTGFDLCLTYNLMCPPGWVCRNGRCLNAVQEKCRDYAGFDVVEVARDVLIYTDTQILNEINNTIAALKDLRDAAQSPEVLYNVSLVPYHNALIGFCGGRKCSDAQCATLPACTRQECSYPSVDKCIGLRQVEFLQVAFLGAITSFTPPPISATSCLAKYVPY